MEQTKDECIQDIYKDINSKLDSNITFVLPESPSIYDHFINLIENSDSYDYSKEHTNKYWTDELKDNKLIRNIVINMLGNYHVPIQEITPILYNYYSYYSTEEHLFLE
jgi:hypothetical protein